MARDAGAKKVFFASAAPAVRYPNVYGIDMASNKEKSACNIAILNQTFGVFHFEFLC
jgi:glutamine phosphoribosylpyrophosphate amidotransferase